MPQRPEASQYTSFQASYVALVPEGDLLAALRAQVEIVPRLVAGTTAGGGDISLELISYRLLWLFAAAWDRL
jgi:hypothetical protein